MTTTTRPIAVAAGLHQLHDCRDEADRNRPTLMELREEGVTGNAAVSLFAARDALHLGDTAEQVRDLLVLTERANPVRVEDVWPDGTPEHWVDWSDYDPTDAELEAAWTGPDAHEAHRAAWQLHQETHARSAS